MQAANNIAKEGRLHDITNTDIFSNLIIFELTDNKRKNQRE